MDVFEPIKESSPLYYVIFTALGAAITVLSFVIKSLWSDNKLIQKEKDALHESKVSIALTTNETMRESMSLVKMIYEQVTKLNEGFGISKFTDQEIKDKLDRIHEDLTRLNNELSASQRKNN
jgi:hypothetical protein